MTKVKVGAYSGSMSEQHVYHHHTVGLPPRVGRAVRGAWDAWCYLGLFFIGCIFLSFLYAMATEHLATLLIMIMVGVAGYYAWRVLRA